MNDAFTVVYQNLSAEERRAITNDSRVARMRHGCAITDRRDFARVAEEWREKNEQQAAELRRLHAEIEQKESLLRQQQALTREEIIRLAQQSGVVPTREGALERFAAQLTAFQPQEEPEMSEKERLFRDIVALEEKTHAYLDTVPYDIRTFLYDNGYSDNLNRQLNAALRVAFGEHYESVTWFLFDWSPGLQAYRDATDKEGVAINSLDEYIAFMKQHEGFE